MMNMMMKIQMMIYARKLHVTCRRYVIIEFSTCLLDWLTSKTFYSKLYDHFYVHITVTYNLVIRQACAYQFNRS